MPTEDDVRRICLALPGVAERESHGRPAWFAASMMARIWEDGVLSVKSADRAALEALDPDTYFWTAAYEDTPLVVLVRLERIDEDQLGELLDASYRLSGAGRHPH